MSSGRLERRGCARRTEPTAIAGPPREPPETPKPRAWPGESAALRTDLRGHRREPARAARRLGGSSGRLTPKSSWEVRRHVFVLAKPRRHDRRISQFTRHQRSGLCHRIHALVFPPEMLILMNKGNFGKDEVSLPDVVFRPEKEIHLK